MADSSTEEHTPLAEALPTEIGGYRILRLLGEGGMGRIYAAQDASLNRQVAIKVMRAEIAAKPDARQRFLREARAAAAVEHESLVPIYRVGEHEGMPYLVMPLLQGMSLETLLKSMPVLPVEWVIALGKQVAEGLAAAHAAGLIHRDIKPANIWIEMMAMPTGGSTFRRARILDFGLARSAAGSDLLTGSGMIVGTPAYMPPEQAAGEPVDHRADIYSLGLVLYRTLTGVNPFERGDIFASLTAIATQIPPSIRERNPQVPIAFEAVVMQMLAKQPQYRIGSAMEVVRRITGQAVDSPLIATPMPSSGSPFDAIDHDTIAVKSPSTRITPKSRSGGGLIWGLSIGGMVLACGVVFGVWKLTQKPETAVVLLKTTESGVVVRFFRDQQQVADADNATEATLPPGTYHAELIAPMNRGLLIEPANFVLKSRERLTLAVQAPIAVKPPVQELESISRERWMELARAMPVEGQIAAVRKRLRTVNAGLDGKMEVTINPKTGHVEGILIQPRGMTQMLPLEVFDKLKSFRATINLNDPCDLGNLRFTRPMPIEELFVPFQRRLEDIDELKGKPIRSLDISHTSVNDLSSLIGTPIRVLDIFRTPIFDLKPLAQLKTLTEFHSGGIDPVPAGYYQPLRDLPLVRISITDSPIRELSAFSKMPLEDVSLIRTAIRDLTPIASPTLRDLRLPGTPILSFGPLQKSPLQTIEFTPRADLPIEPLKAIPTLKSINQMPAADFMRTYQSP